MDDREVMLVGFDIYAFVEKLCDKFSDGDPPCKMTENEEMAYKLGIDNVLTLLDQTLNDMFKTFDEENGYKNIAVHVPGLETVTEFSSIDEIIEHDNL